MKSKLSKQGIEQKVKNIFSKHPAPEQIKKAKKLAMSKNIKLGQLKKKFCKRCYNSFDSKDSEIRIKKGFKTIKCKKCGLISRFKLK